MTHKPIGEIIKQEKFKSDFQKSMINILYSANFLRDLHFKLFNEYNIQGQHYNVMRILKGKHPCKVQPGHIKDVMLDKGCDLTRLLDKLQKMDIIHREPDANNKRKVNVNLTEKGLDILEKMTYQMDEINKSMENNLSLEEYQQLSDLLDKFRGQ
jgi:DNA-binding MarR family transcriptional regulator